MYVIEYLAAPIGQPPALLSELALGSTPEVAKDHADTRLPVLREKFGAQGYRIFDKNKQCIGIGPVGFLDA
jgi:hypothetical protein